MDVSVVIPCFNSAKTIGTQLDALSQSNYSGLWELLIVDNDSTDSSVAIIKKYRAFFPRLEIIKASEKKGAGYARNVGVKKARSNKILFCDADDRVSSNWLKVMSEALDSHEFIAGRTTLENINHEWRIPRESSFGTKARPQEDVFISRFDSNIRIAPACNIGVSKELHFSVGGFDESLASAEDHDYCWRISLTGHRLTFVPDGLVEYRLRQDLKGTYAQQYKWGKWSTAIYRKHVGKGRLIDKLKFIFGGWRHLPLLLLKLHHKSGVYELAAWLGYRIGEIDGCWNFLFTD